LSEGELPKARDIALRYLSFRPRTEHEVYLKLKKHNIHQEQIHACITELKEKDYINDEKFALNWVLERKDYKLRSPSMIRRELLNKGMDKKIIEDSLASGYSDLDEQGVIKKLIDKHKRSKPGFLNDYDLIIKFKRRLVAKGFSLSQIESALKSPPQD
jgi:regulatory protein